MIEKNFEQLMWEKVDGTISKESSDRLREYLEGSLEAREHFEELQRFSRTLEEVGEADPPPALRQRVYASIDGSLYASPSAKRTIANTGRRPFFLNFRMAAVALAGFLLGVIGYYVIDYENNGNRPLDIAKLYGTISIGSADTYTMEIAEAGVEGMIGFRRDRNVIASEVQISSERDVEVRIEQEGQLVQNGGAGAYYFMFALGEEADVPIHVRILVEDTVVFERTVQPSRIPSTR